MCIRDRAGTRRCGLHARRFRLRTRPVLGARRYRRRFFLLGEQALPIGFLRGRGRLDPAVQHFEPAVVGQARPRGDHSRPERRDSRLGEGLLRAVCGRGGFLVDVYKRQVW